MSKQIDDALIYRIAKAYYLNDCSQNEIAKNEQISRSQISRILKKAREDGFVDISVHYPDSNSTATLREKLKIKYNLKDALVSPLSSTNNVENQLWLTYNNMAEYLSKVLPSYSRIGIGWGSTIYNIALQLSHIESCNSMHFYPLNSNSAVNQRFLQSNIIVDRFSEKFVGSIPHYIYQSLYVPENRKNDEWFQNLLQIWQNLDAAIIGVGGTESSTILAYYDENQNPQILEYEKDISGKVGDILARFIFPNHEIFEAPDQYMITGIPLETLKTIKNVIAVAFGVGKIDMLDFAMRNKYFNILLTDYPTAESLLQL